MGLSHPSGDCTTRLTRGAGSLPRRTRVGVITDPLRLHPLRHRVDQSSVERRRKQISGGRVPITRSIGNCQKNLTGPHARMLSTMSSKATTVERHSRSLSGQPTKMYLKYAAQTFLMHLSTSRSSSGLHSLGRNSSRSTRLKYKRNFEERVGKSVYKYSFARAQEEVHPVNRLE